MYDWSTQSLAARTKNFSGAELEGLVKSAASFALNRQVSAFKNLKSKTVFYLHVILSLFLFLAAQLM